MYNVILTKHKQEKFGNQWAPVIHHNSFKTIPKFLSLLDEASLITFIIKTMFYKIFNIKLVLFIMIRIRIRA